MYSIGERKNVNTFPYYISEQPKTINRINLLLIDEDYACKDDETDNLVMKTRYHYCWMKNINRFLLDKNKHKTIIIVIDVSMDLHKKKY